MLRPLPAGGEPGLLGQLRTADEPHDPLGDALRAGRHRDPAAVLGEVGVARRVVGRPVAGALLDLLEGVPDRRLWPEQGQDRLDDGEVDDLASPRGLPRAKGRHRGEGGGQGGDAVGEAERRQGRGTVRLPRDRGEPAHRLGKGAESRTTGVRADLAEPGDAGQDETRVVRRELRVAQAPALERAGAEVLDDDVGVGDETAEHVLALGRAEVERDPALVSVDDLGPEADAVLTRPMGAHRVAPGVFDLDDVGAEVAQHGGRQGTGEQRRDVEDLESG